MKIKTSIFFAAAAAVLACGAPARAEGEAGELYRINSETEAKIQTQVLDSLLGPGKAFVFLETKAEVKSNSDEESKGGIGEVRTKTPGASAETAPAPEGAADVKKSAKDKNSGSVQEQSARQVKSSAEKKEVLKFTLTQMKARILHSADAAPDRLKAVKDALLALYPERIKAEDIVFVPAAFAAK